MDIEIPKHWNFFEEYCTGRVFDANRVQFYIANLKRLPMLLNDSLFFIDFESRYKAMMSNFSFNTILIDQMWLYIEYGLVQMLGFSENSMTNITLFLYLRLKSCL